MKIKYIKALDAPTILPVRAKKTGLILGMIIHFYIRRKLDRY